MQGTKIVKVHVENSSNSLTRGEFLANLMMMVYVLDLHVDIKFCLLERLSDINVKIMDGSKTKKLTGFFWTMQVLEMCYSGSQTARYFTIR